MSSNISQPQLKTQNSKFITLIPIALFLVALALRLWGIGWSLPYIVHPDEPVMVDTAISMIKRGSLDPNFFEYPSLFIYWQYALTQVWLLWQGLTHSGVTAANLPDSSHIYTLTPSLYIWGRAAAAVLGAIGVVVMYWLARRLFNPRVGLIAALLLAVSPFHSENSHYIEVDVMMWTLACVTALLAYEVMVRGAGHRWLALGAGLLVGLTAGAKYTGLAMLGMVGIGWLLGLRRVESKKLKVESKGDQVAIDRLQAIRDTNLDVLSAGRDKSRPYTQNSKLKTGPMPPCAWPSSCSARQ